MMTTTERVVVASFANTLAYHRVAQWRARSRSPFRMLPYLLWVLWHGYFLMFLLAESGYLFYRSSSLLTAALFILCLLVVFNATPAVGIRRAQPIPLLVDALVTWSFTSQRAAVSIGEWERRDFSWQVLHSVDLLPDGMLIVPVPQICHWLPKSAFGNDAEYQQVVRWARQEAQAVREFAGKGVAEWGASLALVPPVLALMQVAATALQSAAGAEESFPMLSTMFGLVIPGYFVGYWIVALVGFFPLRRNRINSWAWHAAAALALGLAWRGISLTWEIGSPWDVPSWIVEGAIWCFAGSAHWWMVERKVA